MQIAIGCSAVALLVITAMGACGSGGTAQVGSGSCAFIAHFEGARYERITVKMAPPEGEPIGIATLPPCDDTGADDSGDGEEIEVGRLDGVSPRDAVLWQGHPDAVLVREGIKTYPQEVTRLLEPPACDPTHAPIRLSGTWLGILGADGKTEVDLEPPYDVDMFVADASEARYEGAFITVRVPKGAGRPLSRDDVRESLWEGGRVTVEVRCPIKGYVAESISAQPPRD